MTDTQQLIARINALAKSSNASPTTLSRKLFGNGQRLDQIKQGGSITMATYARAIQMLDAMDVDQARAA